MPDGLTHVAAGYIGAHKWLTKDRLSLFLAGSLLPDICLRGGRLLFTGQPEKDFWELYLTPLHTPFTAVFTCLALAQFFGSQIRRAVFFLLYAGCFSHFVADFFQRTIEGAGLSVRAIGGYHWFYPFSWLDVQFGIFWAENSPYALLVLIPLVIGLGWRRKGFI